MTRIDDLDAFSRHEPQFAIGGLRYARSICASRSRAEPDTVRGIPNRGRDSALRVGDPRVQFGPRNAYQTTGGVQPQRTIVVLYRPVNRVARQTIRVCERS